MRGRRRILGGMTGLVAGAAMAMLPGRLASQAAQAAQAAQASKASVRSTKRSGTVNDVSLFLCGDVMTGRGIDQILGHPSPPQLFEPLVRDAREYVNLGQDANGPIPRKVDAVYVWGQALDELSRRRPQARIVNLETSITRSGTPWPDKGINYRMHPANAGVLSAADLDACVLANNHVLDWDRDGLIETLQVLRDRGIEMAGAGVTLASARAPAVLPLGTGGRVLVFAAATGDAGVPQAWAATPRRSGVHRLPDLSARTLAQVARQVRRLRRACDLVVFSVHWGGNWGYAVPDAQRRFAHGLIDEAGVDVVHGHSSHHPKAIEVHAGRLVLYGCGDFLNDYEGIRGHGKYRGELVLMYFPTLEAASGRLRALELVPLRIRRFQLVRTDAQERSWLLARLRREFAGFGTTLEPAPEESFRLQWQ